MAAQRVKAQTSVKAYELADAVGRNHMVLRAATRTPVLDAVVHDGEQLLVLLGQGHADHMPGVPFFPGELEYGAGVGALHLNAVSPKARSFFEPPHRTE